LRQQRARAGRAFDPAPRFEPCRELDELVALATVGTHPDLADEYLVLVEHRRAV
jgi:hypothetical protein